MFVSIDIETTGLDPEKNQIIEFAAIIDIRSLAPEECPTFHHYVHTGGELTMSPYIAKMHQDKWQRLITGPWLHPNMLMERFGTFLYKYGVSKVRPIGKNFGSFDLQFLKRLPGFRTIEWGHRTLDPGSFYFNENDSDVPDLEECLRRANLTPSGLHTAYGDALDVLRLIRIGV